MQKIQFMRLSKILAAASFALLTQAQAVEIYPQGMGGQSNFQMSQAQEAIRGICGCVVGNQSLNPNCGPLTAAAVRTQAPNAFGAQPGQMMNGAGGSFTGGVHATGGVQQAPMQAPQMPMPQPMTPPQQQGGGFQPQFPNR